MPDQIVDCSEAPFSEAWRGVGAAMTFADLQAAVGSLVAPYGLQHVVYHALRMPGTDITHATVLLTYPSDWISYYLARRFYSYDPVLRAAEREIAPFDWDDFDKNAPRVRRLFNEASEAGLGRHGLSIPIRGPSGDHALFTITSDKNDADWRSFRARSVADMQRIAHAVHARTLHILNLPFAEAHWGLSQRERECLALLASGLRFRDIADKLGQSEQAIRQWSESARHKLGCLVIPQAVARAVQLGIVPS